MKGKGIEREEMWGWRWDKERETKAPWHYKNTERLALKCKSEISSEVPDKFWVFIIFSPFPPPPLSNCPASLNPFLSSSVFQSSISGFVFSILILNKNWAKNKTEKSKPTRVVSWKSGVSEQWSSFFLFVVQIYIFHSFFPLSLSIKTTKRVNFFCPSGWFRLKFSFKAFDPYLRRKRLDLYLVL